LDTPAGWLARGLSWSVPVVATVAVFLLVELIVRGGLVLRSAFPPPSLVAKSLFEQAQARTYWEALWKTVEGWGLALGIATFGAIPLGILLGTNRWTYRSVRSVVDFVRPIPSVAQLPLVILIVGVTLDLKLYLAAFAAFWPLLFQTLYGVQDVDPVARDTADAYGLNRFMRFTFVSLPGATPYIATGMRIAAAYALLVCVGTEMIVGLPGLGQAIFKAQYAGDVPRMYAFIVTSGFLGMLISLGFRRVERRTLRWHASQRREVPA
jgi:ABC-type nitrate/sulfonate/bicarbonate transport system permease component